MRNSFNYRLAILSGSLRHIFHTLFALLLISISVQSQENTLTLKQYYDSADTSSIWLAYGPKNSKNYSFWYGAQNGIKANWSLPAGYTLGMIKLPLVSEMGDRHRPTFTLHGSHHVLQQIILPSNDEGKGLEISGATISLALTYADCKQICMTKSGSATISLSDTQKPFTDTALIPMRKRGTWARADEQNLNIGMHKNYNKDGRVDRAFFLPLSNELVTDKAPLILDHFKETGFFSTFTLKVPLADNAPIPGILVLDKPDENGLESHYVSLRNDYAMASEMPEQGMKAPTSHTSYLAAILLALIGGLILNVMPCVFPVLALKVFSAIKSSIEDETIVRNDSLAYTLGVLISFMGLAAILIAVRAAGESVGWGYQLQTPAFVLSMALLFFLMGLNFLGFFEIPSFLANTGGSLTKMSGAKGSFFTGVLATLVAAPCTAPFMVTAVAFALAQSPIKTMSIFMALGLGLALPYLIIGFSPASRRFFPKPGKWIETFRSFLAFPMFATVVWMVWILSLQAGPAGVLVSLTAMVLLSFAIWLLRSAGAAKKAIITFVSLVVIITSIATVRPLNNPAQFQLNTEMVASEYEMIGAMPVIPFSQEKLASLRSEGKNVFVHHWAAWCIICLMHENLVFSQDAFQTFLTDNNIVFMQADRTNNDPELLMFMEKSYGRSSQPIDVFYVSDADIKPIVLPTMFTAAAVTSYMKEQMVAAQEK